MLDQSPPPAMVAPAPDVAMPQDLRAMLEAAIADGDPATIEKMFGYARKARPDALPAIDAMQQAHLARAEGETLARAEARRRALAQAHLWQYWKGQVEFGATLVEGPTDNLGLLGSLELEREGLDWVHKLQVRADIQDTEGVRSLERIIGSWQPRYAISPSGYAFGLAQFDRDPLLGIESRYSLGVGAGWTLRPSPKFRASLEGGPAYRWTFLGQGERRNRLAVRGTADWTWTLNPRLELSQRLSGFYEEGIFSGLIFSAADSRLTSRLTLRFSYEYRIEEDQFTGISTSGSTSRASLVYRVQ